MDIGCRTLLLLLWNLTPRCYLKENSWDLQARSCGDKSISSALTGARLIYTSLVQHFWEIVDDRFFCCCCWLHWKPEAFQIKYVKETEFLDGIVKMLFSGLRLWDKFFAEPTCCERRGYWAWKLTNEMGLNWALKSNYCPYWCCHNICLTQTQSCTGQNPMKPCN